MPFITVPECNVLLCQLRRIDNSQPSAVGSRMHHAVLLRNIIESGLLPELAGLRIEFFWVIP